ncbi:NucA/NucB deoxyribonuclease domain-containing protein [Paenibacillus sp. P2(2022)]|uniref:NucA/NucB deoxyribonuclease domain-containing protein n=1 Tax=Paenibacillus TaxID=44249 RepID=UPI0002E19831|nr:MULTISPECIES: NucA/NucB deoxyribonuclease domain-containing protein [Paenibacillus]MDG0053102.1 NucA/NucB deoxyribonuclease domain-containing protein [Paenibacillus sp. P2(2022)]NMP10515.1 nuclease [Paenibacillus polymyxa]
MFKWIFTVLITILLAGCSVQETAKTKTTKHESVPVAVTQVSADTVKLEFPSDRYTETAQHIKEAIAAGKSSVCTIDREGADHNRELSLKGVPTKKGKDRDEWPMAMCSEGGDGADIKYISPKDNRGAGSWVGHKLDDYADGTKVEFIVK